MRRRGRAFRRGDAVGNRRLRRNQRRVLSWQLFTRLKPDDLGDIPGVRVSFRKRDTSVADPDAIVGDIAECGPATLRDDVDNLSHGCPRRDFVVPKLQIALAPIVFGTQAHDHRATNGALFRKRIANTRE